MAANSTIGGLTAVTGAGLDLDADTLGVYDQSAGTTKSITPNELASAIVTRTESFAQSGTGATSRTVQARLRDWVSVKDFGATGDGVTDDTLAIQAALDTGRDVYVPDGTYIINIDRVTDSASYAYGLSASSDQRIELSRDAEFKANNSAINWGGILAVYGKTDVEIVGGRWRGDRALEADTSTELFRHNIDIRGSSRVTVRSAYSYESRGDCFYIGGNPVGGAASDNVTFIACTGHNAHRNNLSIVKCNRFRDYGSTFEEADGANPKAGVDVETNLPDTQDDIAFHGSKFLNNDGSGADVVSGSSARFYDCTTEGNVRGVRAIVTTGTVPASAVWQGGSIKGNSDGGAIVDGAYTSIVVDGTEISGTLDTSESHVKVFGGTGTSRSLTVRKCKIYNTTASSYTFNWSTTDTESIVRIEDSDIFVSAATLTDTLRGLSVVFKGNRYFLQTGYANTNNGGVALTNVPFVAYTDCQFWNDTTNSAFIGAQSALARRQNCFFDVDTYFRGYLSDGQLAKDLTGVATTSGTGEDDLFTYTIPADSLGKDGGVLVRAAGTKTGAGGNKTLKFYVDGVARTFHAAANNTNDWRFEAWLTMNDNSNVIRISSVGYDGTTVVQDHDLEGVDNTAAIDIKITGECANGADAIAGSIWIVSQL